MDLQLKDIKDDIHDLMKTFEQTEIAQLEVETDSIRISMKKPQAVTVQTPAVQMQTPQPQAGTGVAVQQPDNGAVPAGSNASEAALEKGATAVKAPIVGTFYRAPKPGAEPFVKEGQKVNKGDTVGMVEAMKIMNEIPAPADGEILSVEAEDGAFIAFDQILMYLKES